MEQENRNNITIALNDMSNEIKKFKYFQQSVESKLCLLEDQIISSKTSDTSNSDTLNSDTSGFMVTILKDRISSLEGQLKSKDAVIEFLTKQLLTSNVNNSRMKNCDRSLCDNNSSEESSDNKIDKRNDQQKKKVVIIGDSMLNGLHEKGLSMNHKVKVKNYPGGTSEKILDNIDEIVKNKPDCLIIHAGTNDLTYGINLLNQAKKIVKQVKKVSQNTKIVFSSIAIRKDRKYIDKKVAEVNSHLKNYCNQKNIDYIDNSNIKEDHLGVKKLHLNKKGNSVLAKNFLKYLRSSFSYVSTNSSCSLENVKYTSELSEPNDEDVIFKSLRDIRIKNLNRTVFAHLNINSLRNKFDLLTDLIMGNVDVLVTSETKLDNSFPAG